MNSSVTGWFPNKRVSTAESFSMSIRWYIYTPCHFFKQIETKPMESWIHYLAPGVSELNVFAINSCCESKLRYGTWRYLTFQTPYIYDTRIWPLTSYVLYPCKILHIILQMCESLWNKYSFIFISNLDTGSITIKFSIQGIFLHNISVIKNHHFLFSLYHNSALIK